MKSLNRRPFLKAALFSGLALTLPSVIVPSLSAEAEEKVREFRFHASKARLNLGAGPDFWAWTYNGQIPGPEIRVKEGEIIRVILKNYLPEETTIHWHGIPVPNAMDGVPGLTQRGVKAGETFVYEFEAKPAGTFIYHSHARYQLDQGLYGPVIIEPRNEGGSFEREYTLILEDWVTKDNGGVAETRRRPAMGMMHGMRGRQGALETTGLPLLEPVYEAYAVNGRVYPAMEPLSVEKGETVKLRLANASSATIYDLRLAGHSFTITHADGNPVKPVLTDVVRIGMGERYDVEFKANNPGYWLLAAAERGYGEGRLRIPIKYKGIQNREPAAPAFHSGLRFASYRDLRSKELRSRLPERGIDRGFSQVLSGGMHSPNWTINGQIYPSADPLIVDQGDRVRINYRNHSMMPHPMHLHGHFFKLVNPGIPPNEWILKDTVIVNSMEQIEIEMLADNPGKWFHHCHNLYHMEAGMANVLVCRA